MQEVTYQVFIKDGRVGVVRATAGKLAGWLHERSAIFAVSDGQTAIIYTQAEKLIGFNLAHRAKLWKRSVNGVAGINVVDGAALVSLQSRNPILLDARTGRQRIFTEDQGSRARLYKKIFADISRSKASMFAAHQASEVDTTNRFVGTI